MKHVVLLGDSIFDNAAYVAGGPDVVRQLREALGPDQAATLAATDGAVTTGILRQLDVIPADATHLVASVGGNDALRAASVLGASARSVGDALDLLGAVQSAFHTDYAAMLDAVLARNLPTAVCTIYHPRFTDLDQRRRSATALSVLNDIITEAAFSRRLALLDLRLICNHDEDFANPIEPSARGGYKIASAIREFVARPEEMPRRSQVFV